MMPKDDESSGILENKTSGTVTADSLKNSEERDLPDKCSDSQKKPNVVDKLVEYQKEKLQWHKEMLKNSEFVNVGLENFERERRHWFQFSSSTKIMNVVTTASSNENGNYEDEYSYDEVVEGIIKATNEKHYQFPCAIKLSELIGMLVEIWDVDANS